jgi:hypothetical protein
MSRILSYDSIENMLKGVYANLGFNLQPLQFVFSSVHSTASFQPLTFEDISRQYQEHDISWRSTSLCESIRRIFLELKIVPDKLIGFGLGSMELRGTDSTYLQHAALVTICETITAMGHPTPDMFCQDPDYSEADEELLSSLNINILRDPQGFLKVDDTTFVLSFYPDIPVKQIIADDPKFWPMGMFWEPNWCFEMEKAKYAGPKSM